MSGLYIYIIYIYTHINDNDSSLINKTHKCSRCVCVVLIHVQCSPAYLKYSLKIRPARVLSRPPRSPKATRVGRHPKRWGQRTRMAPNGNIPTWSFFSEPQKGGSHSPKKNLRLVMGPFLFRVTETSGEVTDALKASRFLGVPELKKVAPRIPQKKRGRFRWERHEGFPLQISRLDPTKTPCF